jgi:hypothetical protein
MKIIAQSFVLCLSLLTFSVQLSANAVGELTKTIKRDFDITADGSTSISNKHGKVEIKTWNQNKVKIEVFVQVEARSQDDAQRALDAIDVDFSNSSNSVSASTVFDSKLNKLRNGNNRTKLKIDYIVHLPATNNLELQHRHGNAMIDDMAGNVKIGLQHGSFRAGKLGTQAKIHMAHSNGSFTDTGDLTANVSHGKLLARSVGDVDIDIRHATFELENGGTVTSSSGHSHVVLGEIAGFRTGSSSHDQIKIQTAEVVKVNGSHTNVRVRNASKELDLDLNHGGCTAGLGGNFTAVNLVGSHASFGLEVARNAAFDMEASTQHGGLSYPDGMDVRYHVEKNSSKTIKGSIGNNSSNSTLKARLSHGSLKVARM